MANLQQPQITAADTQLTEEELKAKLQQGFKNAIAQQEAQANAMRAMLAQQMIQEGQKGVLGNLDLRPFAQAARQYGATTAVVPAEAPEDGRNIMLKLQQALAEQQQGLGKQQLDYLKAQLEAKRADRQLKQEQKADKNFGLRVRTSVNSSEEAKKVRAIGDLNTKIGTLIDKVSKTGATLTGQDKADLDSAFQDVKVGWKDSAGLGAIQKADEELIKQAIGDSPTTFSGVAGYAISGGKKGLIKKLEGLRNRAITQGFQHLDSAKAAFPYEEADKIFMDMEKKLQAPKSALEQLKEKADKLEKELGGSK